MPASPIRKPVSYTHLPAAVCFVFFFVAWLCMLLFADGRAIDAAGRISIEPYKYLHNFIEMPYLAVVRLLGVVAVLWLSLIHISSAAR